MKKYWIGLVILIVIVGGGFAIWWFTSGRTNSDNNAAKSQIQTNWVAFFNGSTSAQGKINLLQNGQQFAQVIQAQAQSATAKATTATVSSVSLNGSSATVQYTIDINKQPALSNQKGQAVKVNGAWKVGDAAFCGLLQLSGSVPPNCPGGSSQ
ncbi:MAG: hypothetical protein ABSD10_01760 [Candidatus Saccharimonadales bacterium]|jgi:uncharacterized protein YxeA